MNDRIKQLADEAYALCGKHSNDYNGPAFTEKFAELIIKDCLAQVDKVDQMLDDPAEKTGAAWVGLAIAKHFGVE